MPRLMITAPVCSSYVCILQSMMKSTSWKTKVCTIFALNMLQVGQINSI